MRRLQACYNGSIPSSHSIKRWPAHQPTSRDKRLLIIPYSGRCHSNFQSSHDGRHVTYFRHRSYFPQAVILWCSLPYQDFIRSFLTLLILPCGFQWKDLCTLQRLQACLRNKDSQRRGPSSQCVPLHELFRLYFFLYREQLTMSSTVSKCRAKKGDQCPDYGKVVFRPASDHRRPPCVSNRGYGRYHLTTSHVYSYQEEGERGRRGERGRITSPRTSKFCRSKAFRERVCEVPSVYHPLSRPNLTPSEVKVQFKLCIRAASNLCRRLLRLQIRDLFQYVPCQYSRASSCQERSGSANQRYRFLREPLYYWCKERELQYLYEALPSPNHARNSLREGASGPTSRP